MKFTHSDLDGYYNRVLPGGSVLQLIDPNDNSEARWQITAVDSVLFGRRLPSEEFGDVWRGEDGPRQWQGIPEIPQWSIVRDWWQSQFERWQPLESWYGNHSQNGRNIGALWLRYAPDEIATNVFDWPQAIPCLDCGSWILWHEDGYVPGHRSCRNGCKRRWQITTRSGAGNWILRRVN